MERKDASFSLLVPKEAPICRDTSGSSLWLGSADQLFVKSQEHLLHRTEANPQPTTLPPPSAGMGGANGERHVISFIGLPARGKPFMAERLCRYLSFFHGAHCRMFDIADERWNDDEVLYKELETFLEKEDHVAMTQLQEAIDHGDLDDRQQAVRKNVDSGRIAILYSHDEIRTHGQRWSGSSKERRWQMQRSLEGLNVHTRLLFIEVIVTSSMLVRSFIMQREMTESGKTPRGETDFEHQILCREKQIKDYSRMFVTIQDDGSEDELSFMKLFDYGRRIVTNNMRGFLCMRIVQYLSHIHPQRHTIYLSRHGQSTYNQAKKIGGNPGLSEYGEEYACWLGNFVTQNICGVPPGSQDAAAVLSDLSAGESTKEPDGHMSGGEQNLDIRAKASDKDSVGAEEEDDCLSPLRSNKSAVGSRASSISSIKEKRCSAGSEHEVAVAYDGTRLRVCSVDSVDGSVSEGSGKENSCPRLNSWSGLLAVQNAARAEAFTGLPLRVQRPCRLWTSSMKRTIETARHIPHPVLRRTDGRLWQQMALRVYRNLDEIFAGEYEGMTYEEIERKCGDEAFLRKQDKLGYRYPRGESYFDLIARLDALIHELESYEEPLLIISHQATLRMVYAYLMGIPRTKAPKLEVPLHTVIKIEYHGFAREAQPGAGTVEERFSYKPNDEGLQADGQRNL